MLVRAGRWGGALAEGRDRQAPGMQQLLYLQLDQATNFEERKLIRAALRELRQRKRGREPVALLDVATPFLSCCPHSGALPWSLQLSSCPLTCPSLEPGAPWPPCPVSAPSAFLPLHLTAIL